MKKIILINIIVIIFLISSGEIFFRLVLNYNTQGISKNLIYFENNYFFNNKNLLNAKAFGAKIYTDENGFRIPLKKGELKNSEKIFFIGGSGTFGPGVLAENTFVEIINSKLKYNTYNASVFASTLENNLKIFQQVIDQDTKHVFISLAFDDIDKEKRFNFKEIEQSNEEKFTEALRKNKFFSLLNKFLRSNFSIYVGFKNYLTDAPKRYYLNDMKIFKNVDNINKSILILDKFSLNKDKITFFILPFYEQVKKENCYHKDIAEIFYENELKKRNYNYIFFKDYFCEFKNNKNFYLKYDPIHLSKIGHKKISSYLLNYINQKLK